MHFEMIWIKQLFHSFSNNCRSSWFCHHMLWHLPRLSWGGRVLSLPGPSVRPFSCLSVSTFQCPCLGPIWWTIFHCNSNSMLKSFCSSSSCGEVIAMNSCIRHGRCVVVVCTKFCSDVKPYNRVTLNLFWIMMENRLWNGLFVKWVSGRR